MRAASGRLIPGTLHINAVHDVMETWLALHHILVEGDHRGWNVYDTSKSDEDGHWWKRHLIGTFVEPVQAYRAALNAVAEPNATEVGEDIRKAWNPVNFDRFKAFGGDAE